MHCFNPLRALCGGVLGAVLLSSAPGLQAAGPDNNDFANRTVLTGVDEVLPVYLLDATQEPGEPNHAPAPLVSNASIWWTWTAPADGALSLSPHGGFPRIAVYRGDSLADLQLEARTTGSWDGAIPTIPVRSGQTFSIAASLWADGPGEILSVPAPASVRFRFFPRPANDVFADRRRVSGTQVVLSGHTAGATRELGEPEPPVSPGSPTVWWEWTPPESGLVTIRSVDSSGGSLRCYRGTSLDSLQELPGLSGGVPFAVTAGETLQFSATANGYEYSGAFEVVLSLSTLRIASPVSGTVLATPGPVTLRLENIPSGLDHWIVLPEGRMFPVAPEIVLPLSAPGKFRLTAIGVTALGDAFHSQEITVVVQAGSDDVSEAPEVPGNPAILGADVATATVEAGEPTPLPSDGDGSVWWRWRAPGAGRVMVGRGTLPFDIPIPIAEFFTGDSLDRLVPVMQENRPGRLNLTTALETSGGEAYWIRLTRQPGQPRDWASLQFEFQPRAASDAFADPIKLPVDRVEMALPHDFATWEPGEPIPPGSEKGSRWYVFTPPADGQWNLDLETRWNGGSLASATVFTGSSLDSVTQVVATEYGFELPVVRGTQYRLRVETSNDIPDAVTVALRSRFTVPPPNDHLSAAQELPVDAGERSGSTDLATLEPGEVADTVGDRTVWYRFTAPTAGALLARATSTGENADRQGVRYLFAQGDTAASLTWPFRQGFEGAWGAIELDAGESVLVVVGAGLFGPPGPTSFLLEHRFEPRPENDAFASAVDLGLDPVVTTRGTNWLATAEAGEPSLGQFAAGRTVWWRWTAPTNGFLEVRGDGLLVALFTGETVSTLKPVVSADTATNLLGGLRFPVSAGTGYRIAVDRRGSSPRPESSGILGFELTLRLGSLELAQPSQGAVLLAGSPLQFSLKPANPFLDPDWTSVTYRAVDGQFGNTKATNLATVSAPPFAADPLTLPPGNHQVQAVATHRAGEVTFSPVVGFRVSPLNDNFAGAEGLRGRRFTNEVTWSGATTEPGEPSGPSSLRGTLWYRWTAPSTGDLRVSVPAGGNFALFTGTELGNLRPEPVIGGSGFKFFVQAGTPYWGRFSVRLTGIGVVLSGAMRWELTTADITEPRDNALFAAGTDVTVRLDTFEAEGTLARVHFQEGSDLIATVSAPPWQFVWPHPSSGLHTVTAIPETASGEVIPVAPRTFRVAPVNDRFTNAVVLTGTSGREESSTLGAEPEGSGDTSGDIWFEWTAPADGLLFARPVGLGGFVRLSLHTGTSVEALQEVPNRLDAGGGFGTGEWNVRAGVTYRLAVAQSSAATDGGRFYLFWEFQPPTSNDHFAQRRTLEGESGEVLANVVLATLEPGEPDHGSDYPVLASVWWTWTPPHDGVLEISFPDQDAPSNAVRPWAGSDLSSLQPLIPIGNPPVFQSQPRYYRVIGGVPLPLVYVSGLANRSDLRWAWRLLKLPANDLMADASLLRGTSVTVTGSTLGAGHEAGEPWPAEDLQNTVWWTWVAPADGDLTLTLRNLRLTHSVLVYRGKDPRTGILLQNHPAGSGSPSTSFLRVSVGETYQILVGALEAPGQEFELELGMRLRPENDDFSRRQRLEGAIWAVDGANWLSTREFREPLHGGRFGGRSVWYAWRAPRDGEAVVSLSGESSPFTLLAVYEGDQVENLAEVASIAVGERNAPLRFSARAGRDYAIAVDGESGSSSRFGLVLQLDSETAVPSLSVLRLGNSGFRITTSDIPSGVWSLEESVNLVHWFPLMDLQPPRPQALDLPEDPERPARFLRLRRRE